jgi:hypothetical protein
MLHSEQWSRERYACRSTLHPAGLAHAPGGSTLDLQAMQSHASAAVSPTTHEMGTREGGLRVMLQSIC